MRRSDYKNFFKDMEYKKNCRENAKKLIIQKIKNKIIENREAKEFILPKDFSLKNNSEEVLFFCKSLIDYIKKEKNANIFLNMAYIENVSADALMYLLTIIKNSYANFKGKLPLNDEMKSIVNKTGFSKFFKTADINKPNSKENIQINFGNNIDIPIQKSVSDFTAERVNDNISSRYIYKMITELMTNTSSHAYDKNIDFFKPEWSLYVEAKEDYIEYVFLDVGKGIINTVKKKLIENICNTNVNILKSTLNGDNRSSTGMVYRNKGLPEIYNLALENKIADFKIITNNVFYSISDSYMLENELNGTLIEWKIERK